MMSSRSIVTVVGFLLCTGVSAVQATVVEWQLQNVTFDDGGTASGFVSVDSHDHESLPDLVDWGIEVRGGNTVDFPPFAYTPASTFYAYIRESSRLDGRPIDELQFGTPQRTLYLVTHPVITGGGRRVHLDGSFYSPSRETFGGTPPDDPPPFVRLSFGDLTAVPEASRALLVAVGMVMLFCVWTRRGA